MYRNIISGYSHLILTMSKRAAPPKKSIKQPYKKKKTSIYKMYGSSAPLSVMKRIDYVDGATAFTLNPSIPGVYINNIGGGDNFNQRDGVRVRYKSLEFRGDIFCNPQATGYAEADLLRIIIVYDRQPNLALAVWSNVVASSAGTFEPRDPLNYVTRQRFLVVMDKSVRTKAFSATVAAGVPTFTSSSPMPLEEKSDIIHVYKKFNFELDSTFTGTGNTIAACETGAFLLFVQSSDFTSLTTPWFLNWSTSILYTDTPCGK